MAPKISIIVPCYNQAQYLDECLQSVLHQTYENWECIIVNDGSPDNTDEVVKKWIEKDKRFKYISKQNGGLSSARNTGVEIANGEWILPLDCDDKIGKDYLYFAQKEFKNGYTIIYSNACFFGEIEGPWNLKEYNFQTILKGNVIFCSGFFRKKDWIIANGYDINLKYGREDWDFWLSILNEDSKVLKLEYLGFYYRRKVNSMDVEINQNLDKKNFSENYIYKKHLSKYLKYDKNNAIANFNLVSNKLKQLHFFYNIINKNMLSKILFKLIKQIQ